MKRLCVATILGAILATGFTAASAQRGTSRSSASPGESKTTIRLSECRIKLKDHAILASDRPGILDTIKYDAGHTVRAGEVVAGLKAEVAIAAHNVAKLKAEDNTEIDFAIKAEKLAQQELKKAREVNKDVPGTISQIEIDRLKLDQEKAAASVAKSKMQKKILAEQAKEAKAQLSTFQIVAPFAGTVQQKLKSVGEAVRQGDPILEIINTDVVLVEGYIDFRDRPQIKVGNKVTVQLEDSDLGGATGAVIGQPHVGKIVFIDQTARALDRTIFIKAEIKNPKKALYPGLTARMIIEPGTQFKE